MAPGMRGRSPAHLQAVPHFRSPVPLSVAVAGRRTEPRRPGTQCRPHSLLGTVLRFLLLPGATLLFPPRLSDPAPVTCRLPRSLRNGLPPGVRQQAPAWRREDPAETPPPGAVPPREAGNPPDRAAPRLVHPMMVLRVLDLQAAPGSWISPRCGSSPGPGWNILPGPGGSVMRAG